MSLLAQLCSAFNDLSITTSVPPYSLYETSRASIHVPRLSVTMRQDVVTTIAGDGSPSKFTHGVNPNTPTNLESSLPGISACCCRLLVSRCLKLRMS